jgi:hypothetical protein
LITWAQIDLTSAIVLGIAEALGGLGWHVRNNPEISAFIAESSLTLFVREAIVGV